MSTSARVRLVRDDDRVQVTTQSYTWTWTAAGDLLTLADRRGRTIVSGPMQPAVVTGRDGAARYMPGRLDGVDVDGERLTVTYSGVNGADVTTVSWRFEAERCWIDPVEYSMAADADVISLVYFARAPERAGDQPRPGLLCRYLIHPGISGSAAVSPVIQTQAKLDTLTWLGRGGGGAVPMRQQWGLPVHYVAGIGSSAHPVEVGAMTSKLSDAFCLGLGDLPAGDLLLRFQDERFSPVLQMHGDLWGHLRGPATFALGAPMVFTVGPAYPDAIRAYQRALVESGIVSVPAPSRRKAEAATSSQFNTWGAQLAAGKASQRFDQAGLEAIHAQLLGSGLDVGMFVIDDKWEGEYGKLEHAPDRFPEFERALADVRGHGHRIGLWAAFLRCDDPATHGLSAADLLSGPDGAPIVLGPAEAPYFLFDVTRAGVREVLRHRIAAFVAHYRPDMVKFDFGYEIPDLSQCAPSDLSFAGERLLGLALDVVVGALRAADPDIVVMYYSLSPLFAPYVDLHSLDDPWMNAQEYHAEANRRLYFSRLLGELGTPTYGSGGYDWVNQVDIWFDSVAAGPLGMLSSFTGDLSDSSCTPEHVAAHNGLVRLARRSTRFRVEAIGASGLGPVTGARSSSWVRLEDGAPVLVVLRVAGFLGAPGVREYGGLLSTDADVAVGSLDTGGLATARRIGVVPRGDGELILRFVPAGESVAVVVHTLDGGRHESSPEARDGELAIPLSTAVDGVPVTWIELVRR
ncbi:alpha-galactosidase [Jiangella alkaliphila]|uniref:Alpha-galactosidase n=1 Tax=Jiangella alkaliphila TaxID=419479 RepID=A0A1H2JSY6_9ACTN|nr:hypothetical protein [Jiangella alkaliphila]SDU59145.1 hypothetical protein SAMN04488563_3009 [Jiangella alkaliphila]